MSEKYDRYLYGHIDAVNDAMEWMLDNLKTLEHFTEVKRIALKARVSDHDKSKFSPEEYDAYDAYFYGDKDETAFNRAWLHHIHHNPHHWQHWLLTNDDGLRLDQDKVVALEMPEFDALEMIADWWSFSWRSGNLEEVFKWYEDHRDNIVLHENTRGYVESVLGEINAALESGNGPKTTAL